MSIKKNDSVTSLSFIVIAVVGLLYAYIASFIFTLFLAFIMQFLFPAFINIVAINWPNWVRENASNYWSWVIVIFSWRLIIGSFIPINAKVEKKN
jgi:hypothetical protein